MSVEVGFDDEVQPRPSDAPLATPTWPAVKRLLGFAAPHKGILIVAALLLLAASGITLAVPMVSRDALDAVAKSMDIAALDRFALTIAALVLVGGAIGFVQTILVARAGSRIVLDLRMQVYERLQRLPVAFYDRTRAGDLGSRISSDATQVQGVLTGDLVNLASNLATLVGGLVVAVVIDWRLTSAVVAILLVMMAVFVVLGRQLRELNRKLFATLGKAVGIMMESLSNTRLIKAFAREKHEAERARRLLAEVYSLSVKSSVWEAAFATVAFSGFVLLLLAVVWWGGRQLLLNQASLGSLAAFFITVTIIAGPMGSLAQLYTRLQRALGAAERLFAVLDEPDEPEDAPNAGPFPERADVELRGVAFRYKEDVPVLQGIDLAIPEGKATALVGGSGGGKTTIASLLFRLYELAEGQILIGGVDHRTIRRQALREAIGLVPQMPLLLGGTIRENIRFGRLDASEEDIRAAAQAANVLEFAEGLPDGLDTVVGERGVTLSGGQAQRVSIARALLKNPRILVLDEATSSLDNASERLVQEALERLMAGRTTLVVAHRLTTIQNADQIVVLEQGRVAEKGRHQELIDLGGRYAELWAQADRT